MNLPQTLFHFFMRHESEIDRWLDLYSKQQTKNGVQHFSWYSQDDGEYTFTLCQYQQFKEIPLCKALK